MVRYDAEDDWEKLSEEEIDGMFDQVSGKDRLAKDIADFVFTKLLTPGESRFHAWVVKKRWREERDKQRPSPPATASHD